MQEDYHKRTMDRFLHRAASRGDVDKARELLKHGKCDVNCRGIAGNTPLLRACNKGHIDMVRILISADTTLQDRWGYTPLHKAALVGGGELALILITEFDCDANLPNNKNGYTIIFTLCMFRKKPCKCSEDGWSLSVTTNDGDTPLHIAAARGHDECVEALLQLDAAPVTLKNTAEKTAIHVACEGGHVRIVKMPFHVPRGVVMPPPLPPPPPPPPPPPIFQHQIIILGSLQLTRICAKIFSTHSGREDPLIWRISMAHMQERRLLHHNSRVSKAFSPIGRVLLSTGSHAEP